MALILAQIRAREGWTLETLFRAGKLADPELDPNSGQAWRQARDRREVALRYAAMHFALLAARAGHRPAKFGDWYATAMTAPPGRSRILAHQVLDRAVLYQMPPTTPGQEEVLRRVLQRFIDSARKT